MSVEVVPPIHGQAVGFLSPVVATPTFTTTGIRSAGGSHLMQCAAAAANVSAGWTHVAGKRVLVESFYFRYTAYTSGTGAIYTFTDASGNGGLMFDANKKLHAYCANTGTDGAVTAALTVNQWYRIDVRVDSSGAVTTLEWKLDGVTQGTATSASQAAADLTASKIGVLSNTPTLTVQHMDWVISYTSGDYPLGEYACVLLPPTGMGTNHITTGAFQNTGGALTGSDYQAVDEFPPSAADYIAQTTAAAGDYVEFTLPDNVYNGGNSAPVCGVLIGSYAGSAANAYAMEIRAYDGTTEGTDRTASRAKTGTTQIYQPSGNATTAGVVSAIMTAAPSGAWTNALLNALRIRFGYSSDVSPNPRLYDVGVIAAFPAPVMLAPAGAGSAAGVVPTTVAEIDPPSTPMGSGSSAAPTLTASPAPAATTGSAAGDAPTTAELLVVPTAGAGSAASDVPTVAAVLTEAVPAPGMGSAASDAPTSAVTLITPTTTGASTAATPTVAATIAVGAAAGTGSSGAPSDVQGVTLPAPAAGSASGGAPSLAAVQTITVPAPGSGSGVMHVAVSVLAVKIVLPGWAGWSSAGSAPTPAIIWTLPVSGSGAGSATGLTPSWAIGYEVDTDVGLYPPFYPGPDAYPGYPNKAALSAGRGLAPSITSVPYHPPWPTLARDGKLVAALMPSRHVGALAERGRRQAILVTDGTRVADLTDDNLDVAGLFDDTVRIGG